MNELDYTVLAVISRRSGLSAYQVRLEFARSPSQQWSSSAGSIYPAVKRLIAAGLVNAGQPKDGRGGQPLTSTSKGLQAVREWVLSLDADIAGPVADPLHTRAQFLSLVPPAARRSFISKAGEANEHSLERVGALCRELQIDKTPDELRGALGVFHQLQARRAWLLAISTEDGFND
jgi:DNA-binding PadR family transcriptional regulator